MAFYKELSDDTNYIVSVSEGTIGENEITESEYETIMDAIGTLPSQPAPPEGFGYRLKTDLTWELFELPPSPPPEEDDADVSDYQDALERLGVDV